MCWDKSAISDDKHSGWKISGVYGLIPSRVHSEVSIERRLDASCMLIVKAMCVDHVLIE